jgi:hypothetical protein
MHGRKHSIIRDPYIHVQVVLFHNKKCFRIGSPIQEVTNHIAPSLNDGRCKAFVRGNESLTH